MFDEMRMQVKYLAKIVIVIIIINSIILYPKNEVNINKSQGYIHHLKHVLIYNKRRRSYNDESSQFYDKKGKPKKVLYVNQFCII